VLGLALFVGCFGYLAGVVTDILVREASPSVLMLFGAVGGLPELALLAWLLVMGVRVPARRAPAGNAPAAVPAPDRRPSAV